MVMMACDGKVLNVDTWARGICREDVRMSCQEKNTIT